MRELMIRSMTTGALFGALAACDTRPDTYLESCRSESDCADGLECVEVVVREELLGSECSIPCTTNEDCPAHPCVFEVVRDRCDDGFCTQNHCE